MSERVNFPRPGMGIDEGTVVRWLKQCGDRVERGEVLVELETAKALSEVTSPVSGEGNLEIYNMMGQRVKTVYTGFISTGTQSFELSLPTQQISTLVYVLRIGDKKMTGKILQINQ